jgi:hypothetical protein
MGPRQLPVLLLALALPACGGNSSESTAPARDPGEGLRELGEVYQYRAAQRQPAPAKIEDLGENQGALDTAWPLVQDGTIVVIWKAGYAANSAEVLAYEKTAPTQGGKVLLRNGTVKQMTADEFRAAPKAK